MAELRLPPGPDELLAAIRKPLAYHLGGEHHLTLGGGTALAMRWAHRSSIDLDFTADYAINDRLPASGLRTDIDRITGGKGYVTFTPGLTRIAPEDFDALARLPGRVPLPEEVVPRGAHRPLRARSRRGLSPSRRQPPGPA